MCNVFWDHQQVRDSFVCHVENICQLDTVASHCRIVRHHCDDVWVSVLCPGLALLARGPSVQKFGPLNTPCALQEICHS